MIHTNSIKYKCIKSNQIDVIRMQLILHWDNKNSVFNRLVHIIYKTSHW